MRRIFLLVPIVAFIAGCGATPATLAAVPLEQSSSTTSPTPTPTAPAAVGSKQETRDDDSVATVAVMRIRSLQPVSDGLVRAGYKYLGVDAKVCVIENKAEPVTVSSAPWMLSFADDTTAEATAASGNWFNVPLYPQDRMVRAGSCVRGWIAFEVPKDSKPKTLLYQPGSGNALEWRVK